jgi:hypothetical protein
MDRIRNDFMRGSLKVASVTKKRINRLAWCGHVMRRDSHLTKRVMSMNVDRHPSRGRSKKR